MNKCKINMLVVALVLLVPCLAFALPGAHDPSSGLGYACDSCHIAPLTMGNLDSNYSTNVCLKCHSTTGSLAGQTQKNFAPEDYANPFGTTNRARGANPLQTSHKWFGTDVVPAAGAVAPVDTSLNGLNKRVEFQGSLFCARCHNVHGTSGAQSTSSPYLRYPNDSDQLCLNCHRPRDTQDHTVGTHPVNVTYSSAKIASGDLLRTPLDNPSNPTGVVKLVNGKVVCSSCHRMHNTDSRTGTFDPYSTTHTFGALSSSKGYLLRVDPISKDGVNGLNICINCHANRKNHNLNNRLSKAPVQCVDCHSGHVEYDPATPGSPNVNLVRRYLVYTTAGRLSKKIIYRSTTNTNRFYDASGTGVCQSCHRPPADHYTGGTYTAVFNPDGIHGTCTDCHSHKNTAGSFSYGSDPNSCTNTCHGLPPKTSSGLNGPASGYTRFDEATTPHVSHAAGGGANVNDFDCTECHNTGYSMDNVVVGEIFKSPAGKIAAKNGANPTYISASATCQNVYCHSNGNNVWKTGMNNIQWGSNKYGTIVGQSTECITCHDDPNSSASHSKHVLTGTGMGYGCITCHAATVTNNTTLTASAKLVGGTHVNGTKDMAYSGIGAAVDRLSGSAVGATCANIACHSNGKGAVANITPSWGSAASGACGACHWSNTTSTVLNTGAHSKHFGILLSQNGTNAPSSVCAACHTYTTEIAASHVNGTLNITSGCSSCHTDPYGGGSNAPTWYSSSSGCGACHTGTGAFTGTNAGPATGSHNKHMALPSALCNQCHAGAQANSTGGSFHTDGNIDVTAVSGYPVNVSLHAIGTYTGTCSTNCHSVTNANVTTITWGVSATCASCHTGTGAFTVNNGPATGAHSKHTAVSGITCGSCHAGAIAGSAGGSGHYNNGINVSSTGYPANTAKHASGVFGASTCVSTCHSATNIDNTTPTWGATASCVTCHGVVTPVTGSHTSHTALAGGCTQCHTGAVAGATAPTGTHYNNFIDVTNNGYPANVVRHATTTYGASATCSTSTCHGSLSPVWGVTTANAACTKCHGTGTVTVTSGNRYVVAPSAPAGTDTGLVSANVKTGAHQTHLRYFNGFSNYSTVDYRCEACHGTLPAAGTYTHANSSSSPQGKFQNLATKWGARSATFTSGSATCSNTYCHNPVGTGGTLLAANSGSNASPTWNNPGYIADGTRKTLTNCGTCHKVPGIAGFTASNPTVHDLVTIATSCVGCHGHDGDTQGAIGRRHMDGIKYGSGTACNDCHGYPPLSAADYAARGVTVGAFVNAKTEDYAGGGGSHAKHLIGTITIADNFTPCLPCHPSSGHPINPAQVLKANVRVMDATNESTSRFDSTRATRYNVSTMKCSNISCHFQPTSAW